jgi:hypothetical protein
MRGIGDDWKARVMGLVVFAVMGVYLLLAIGVVVWVVRTLRPTGGNAFLWGGSAALVMYLIPFWDLIPTVVMNRYYCEKYAGFWVYKTVDQWKAHNQNVLPSLSMGHLPEQHRVASDSSLPKNRKYLLPDGTSLSAFLSENGTGLLYVEYKKPDGESGYQLNERFRLARSYQGPGLIKLSRTEYTVIDTTNNEVMARQVDFQTGTKGRIWSGGEDWWKFWFQTYDTCVKDHGHKFLNGGIHAYAESLQTDCLPERKTSLDSGDISVVCKSR